uniref:Dol-P-Glc:Glc(2)Man(9)GlcNAc(2)-PP-Dol alpha-1,2-glucosyltransferase n=1 Tax=Pinguiococcus pyrenoidosus TaxID=172671 RepID=A0A7R9U9B9_9STRA
MDEIFHAAQTQQYCEGDFTTWDPKITTFPGLYYAGLASARAREGFGESAQSACSLTSLRAVNAVFGVLSFLAMALFFATRGFRPVSAVLHAAALTLYAPHFFYHSLYYTDPGATCLVILMLLAARREHHSLAAILGALAIFFRQNNVVWVAFALGAAALRVVEDSRPTAKRVIRHCDDKPTVEALASFGRVLQVVWSSRLAIVRKCWPFALPLGAFVAFLIRNGGSVVVGDKANHEMVPHLAMLGYFFVLVWLPYGLVGSYGVLSQETFSATRSLLMQPGSLILMTSGTTWLLSKYSYGHIFLLSDNRHLTFYIWNRLLGKSQSVRALFGPAYAVSSVVAMGRLSAAQGYVFACGFFLAIALLLVPARLLEFRYFTLPVLVYHLHAPERNPANVVASIFLNGTLSFALLYVFLYRPFQDADGQVQRFML